MADNTDKNPQQAAAPGGWRWLRFTLKWGLTLAIWGALFAALSVGYFAYDLPSVEGAAKVQSRPSVTILAADGTEIAQTGDVSGAAVQVRDLPFFVPQAVIATEDRRFYEHFGVDLIGIARAIWVNARAGRIRQGGSTISQQAAKNLFLTPERTIRRKVREIILALWLEHNFTKDQILTVYLNRVYFGAGAYGIDAAARRYFGVPATRLNLHQAAVIAGLLKAPSRLNPLVNPAAAKRRAKTVISNMLAAGYLTQGTSRLETARPLRFAQARARQKIGRHFTDWITEQLPDLVGAGARKVIVRTTLDPRLQALAEGQLKRYLARIGKASNIGNGALVMLGRDGAVRAMAGSRDYAKSQFNRAVQAMRQPGSVFKPVVYLAGLRAGIRPETRLNDAPIDIDGWKPRNYDGRFRGFITAAEGMAKSVNIIAVKIAEKAGRNRVIEAARDLGLSTDLPAHASLALGAAEVSLLEMTAAYAVFANGGTGVWAHGITEIRGQGGAVIYRRAGGGPGRVVSADNAAAMSRMLAGVIKSGTGKAAAIDRPAAGKTGTSQDFRDAWFIGYSADLITGIWMGNDNAKPMRQVTGGGAPARLWSKVMSKAHAGRPPRPLAGLDDQESSAWRRVLQNLDGGG
jgi:penicillin-binding protein 1A